MIIGLLNMAIYATIKNQSIKILQKSM